MVRADRPEDQGYERRDIDVALIAKLLGLGSLVAALALFGVFWLFSSVRDRETAADPVRSPYAANPTPSVGPKLQASPPTELQEILENERQILESYGWLDRERGIVRIPIDRAMELMLERGYPRAAADEAGSEDSP